MEELQKSSLTGHRNEMTTNMTSLAGLEGDMMEWRKGWILYISGIHFQEGGRGNLSKAYSQIFISNSV